jgi:SH3-like domain-containing protein
MILLLYSCSSSKLVAYFTPYNALKDLESPVVVVYVFDDGTRKVRDAKGTIAWVNQAKEQVGDTLVAPLFMVPGDQIWIQ